MSLVGIGRVGSKEMNELVDERHGSLVTLCVNKVPEPPLPAAGSGQLDPERD